jgi:hypothetical protein
VKKKISALALSGFLILGVASPVQAATAGGSCPKDGATAKIGKNNYVCAKNPFFSKTKLTWVLLDCFDYNKDYSILASEAKGKNLVENLNQAEVIRAASLNSINKPLNDLITWQSLLTYKLGNIVYLEGGTYYQAQKNSTNKKPSKTNVGVGKFWLVYSPTAANKNVGTMPNPSVVTLQTASQISALKSAKKQDPNLISNIENKLKNFNDNSQSIQSVIDLYDEDISFAKQFLESLNVVGELTKDICNPKNAKRI